MTDAILREIVNQQYFLSCGNIHEFCRTRDSLIARIDNDCPTVHELQSIWLLNTCIGGNAARRKWTDVDVTTSLIVIKKTLHNQRFWAVIVNSGYIF